MMRLKDKVAIITGASRGIGFATADAFLREGAKIIIAASKKETAKKAVEQLKEKYPESDISGISPDLSNYESVHQAFSNIVSMIRHAENFEIPILIGIPTPFIPERIPNQEWVADRDSEYITQQCEKFAQALRAFCTMRDVPYVDYRNAFLNEDGSVREDMFADGLHPNGKGHVAMAEVLCQRLNELFPTKQ